jgi:hypothetical protein
MKDAYLMILGSLFLLTYMKTSEPGMNYSKLKCYLWYLVLREIMLSHTFKAL